MRARADRIVQRAPHLRSPRRPSSSCDCPKFGANSQSLLLVFVRFEHRHRHAQTRRPSNRRMPNEFRVNIESKSNSCGTELEIMSNSCRLAAKENATSAVRAIMRRTALKRRSLRRSERNACMVSVVRVGRYRAHLLSWSSKVETGPYVSLTTLAQSEGCFVMSTEAGGLGPKGAHGGARVYGTDACGCVPATRRFDSIAVSRPHRELCATTRASHPRVLPTRPNISCLSRDHGADGKDHDDTTTRGRTG